MRDVACGINYFDMVCDRDNVRKLAAEMHLWQAWHEKNSTTYVQPKMYQRPVSAHKLWHTVMAYGGYDMVCLLPHVPAPPWHELAKEQARCVPLCMFISWVQGKALKPQISIVHAGPLAVHDSSMHYGRVLHLL